MPVACSPEIVRLHIELFPRPTWEDSKLAGLEVANTAGPVMGKSIHLLARATSIYLSA